MRKKSFPSIVPITHHRITMNAQQQQHLLRLSASQTSVRNIYLYYRIERREKKRAELKK